MQEKSIAIIEEKLIKQLISGKTLLSRFRMLMEDSKDSAAYSDPRYAPFYYYAGQELSASHILEIGLRIGICSGSFLAGSSAVQSFLGFQESSEQHYSPRLAVHNLKDRFRGKIETYVGKIWDELFLELVGKNQWDVAIINEERNYDTFVGYLDLAWQHLSLDGTILMDYVNYHKSACEAYYAFCRRVNRPFYVFNTRYGVGLITK